MNDIMLGPFLFFLLAVALFLFAFISAAITIRRETGEWIYPFAGRKKRKIVYSKINASLKTLADKSPSSQDELKEIMARCKELTDAAKFLNFKHLYPVPEPSLH